MDSRITDYETANQSARTITPDERQINTDRPTVQNSVHHHQTPTRKTRRGQRELIVLTVVALGLISLFGRKALVHTHAAALQSPTVARTIWSDTTVPSTTDTQMDSSAVELGVRFRSSTDGFITGVRFYKGTTNTGVHVGNLWSNTGRLLATAAFSNESATGWQEVTFANAVAVTANTTYVASYHTTVGRYAIDSGFFATSGVTNNQLQALADGADGANGVYAYGSGGFPNNTFHSANYWVDIAFSATAPPPSTTISRSIWSDTTVPGITDFQGDSAAVELGVKFRSSVAGFITGVRFIKELKIPEFTSAICGTVLETFWRPLPSRPKRPPAGRRSLSQVPWQLWPTRPMWPRTIPTSAITPPIKPSSQLAE